MVDLSSPTRSTIRARTGAADPRPHPLALPILLGALGFAARVAVNLLGGGLHGVGDYDDAVYFSAADALVHGRLPYRDFLFLQPPGIVVVLAPFAALGSLVGDPAGWAVARIAFLLLGGLNTALSALALRRLGRFAQLAGGLGYALFIPAIYSERSTQLEPIGTTAVLLTLAVTGSRERFPRWLLDPAVLACGAAFGLAITTKLWYLVPAVLMLPLLRRGAVAFGAAAAATALAVVVPFAVADPSALWREVVADQVGRPRISPSLIARFRAVAQPPNLPPLSHDAAVVIVAVAVTALAITALTVRGARRFVVQLAAALAVLAVSPSYYRHYAALAVPFLVLVGAVALARLRRLVRSGRAQRIVQAALLVGVVAYTGGAWYHAGFRTFTRPPLPASYEADVHRLPGCVTADNPTWLILTDRLTTDLDRHCAVWPDPTGWRYDRDAASAAGVPAPLARNGRWQQHVLGFLSTGNETLLRHVDAEFDAANRERVHPVKRFPSGYSIVVVDPG